MKEDTDLDDVHVPRYVFSKKNFRKDKKSKEKQIQRNFFSFSFMKIEFNEQNSEKWNFPCLFTRHKFQSEVTSEDFKEITSNCCLSKTVGKIRQNTEVNF